MYIIICETDRQSRFNASDRVLRTGALGWPWGMGWGGRWERGSGWEHTYTHGWFMSMYGKNHYNVVISLQLKKKICSLHQLEYWGMGRWGSWKAVAFCFQRDVVASGTVSSGNVDLKKNKQLKSCEFKLYSGTLEKTIAGRQLLSSSEEIAPKK